MAGIDIKIMAFVGTEDCSRLITQLATFTNNIYAAVSSRYGESPFPGGNITIISSYLDGNGIQRWLDRTGAAMIIDGTEEGLDEESALIEQKAQENGAEYFRLKTDLRLSRNVKQCASRQDILDGLKYTSGNILAEGPELYEFLTGAGTDPDRILVSAKPDAEEMQKLAAAGCPEERIFSFGMVPHEDFLLALLDELDIKFCVMKGGHNRGIAQKAGALSHSDATAFTDGMLADKGGLTAGELWKKLSERFGLKN